MKIDTKYICSLGCRGCPLSARLMFPRHETNYFEVYGGACGLRKLLGIRMSGKRLFESIDQNEIINKLECHKKGLSKELIEYMINKKLLGYEV